MGTWSPVSFPINYFFLLFVWIYADEVFGSEIIINQIISHFEEMSWETEETRATAVNIMTKNCDMIFEVIYCPPKDNIRYILLRLLNSYISKSTTIVTACYKNRKLKPWITEGTVKSFKIMKNWRKIALTYADSVEHILNDKKY